MLRGPQAMWVRYAVAVLSIVVAAAARWLLSRLFGGVYPAAPVFLAILFSAWFGGFGPSLLVALLGLVLGFLTADGRSGNGHPVPNSCCDIQASNRRMYPRAPSRRRVENHWYR